ncbi:MAG: hypothetical protein R6U50_07295 [Desulfobacterales bacterium]
MTIICRWTLWNRELKLSEAAITTCKQSGIKSQDQDQRELELRVEG